MSGAAFDQLPYDEGRRLELVQREPIEVLGATPEHQLIVLDLGACLREYFRREQRGGVIPDVEFGLGEDNRLRPDLAILLGQRWTSLNRKKTPIPLAPDIVVEVVSPSDKMVDSLREIWMYLGAGVQEVWQVSAETRQILIYHGPKSITVLDIGEMLSTPLLPGWEISLREIFGA